MHRHLAPTVAVLAVAIGALSGCSTGSGQSDQSSASGAVPESSATSESSESSETGHNDQDIAFAQMMIPHHQQAIEMSDTLLAKDGVDEDVVQLATDIEAAQSPEIETMQGWLDQWGAPSMDAMSGDSHDTGMSDDDTMMSQEDMDALAAASGEDASALYLEQMIQHHLSAVDMAYEEINDGMNSDAVALAHSIVDSQSDEISTMQGMLASM